MKKAIFRADPNKGGFITSFITPVNSKPAHRFNPMDAMLLMTLVVGLVMTMRFLLAR
jgi:hypothetical protein